MLTIIRIVRLYEILIKEMHDEMANSLLVSLSILSSLSYFNLFIRRNPKLISTVQRGVSTFEAFVLINFVFCLRAWRTES